MLGYDDGKTFCLLSKNQTKVAQVKEQQNLEGHMAATKTRVSV